MMFRITHLKSVWEWFQEIDKKLLIKSEDFWTTEKRILSGFIAAFTWVSHLCFLGFPNYSSELISFQNFIII